MLTASMQTLSCGIMISNPQYQVFIIAVHFFLVVELDLPWDDRQVETFGASFKAWTEVEFETAIMSIRMPALSPILHSWSDVSPGLLA